MNVSWMENRQYLAQVGHFFGGAWVIETATLLGHHSNHVVGWTFGIGWQVAMAKEFWFDIKFEKDTLKNSAMDFGFYVAGAIVGLVVFALTR